MIYLPFALAFLAILWMLDTCETPWTEGVGPCVLQGAGSGSWGVWGTDLRWGVKGGYWAAQVLGARPLDLWWVEAGSPGTEPCISYRAEGGMDGREVQRVVESAWDWDSGIYLVGRRTKATNSEYAHCSSCLKQVSPSWALWRTLKWPEY